MKVSELIELLGRFSPDAEIRTHRHACLRGSPSPDDEFWIGEDDVYEDTTINAVWIE